MIANCENGVAELIPTERRVIANLAGRRGGWIDREAAPDGGHGKPTNFDSVKSRLRLAILSSHARCRSSSLLVNQSRCNHPNIRKVCCEPALRRMTLCGELVFVERGERSFTTTTLGRSGVSSLTVITAATAGTATARVVTSRIDAIEMQRRIHPR